MGEDPSGLLTYSADGTMLAVMARGDRARFASDDVTGGTPEEQAGAFSTCIAYGGSYVADDAAVTHHVEVSLFPNWIGTDQRRQWQLSADGRVLTLSSPPLDLGGQRRVQQLTWLRRGAVGAQSGAGAGEPE